MKTTLAMVCGFLLAGAPLLATSAPETAACVKQARSCCKHGVTMPCCQAKPSPDSQPAPGAGSNPLSLLALGVLIWTVPSNPADSISFHSTLSAITAGAPLYARDCARLI